MRGYSPFCCLAQLLKTFVAFCIFIQACETSSPKSLPIIDQQIQVSPKAAPSSLLNQVDSLDRKIGIWESSMNGLHEKYDSVGRFAGYVYYYGEGKFNWHHPYLLTQNSSHLNFKFFQSISLDGMLSHVLVGSHQQKGLFLKVVGDFNATVHEQTVQLNQNGKVIAPINLSIPCLKALKPIITYQNPDKFSHRKGYFNTSFGKLEIEILEMISADTNLSKLKLLSKQGDLALSFGGNIQVFEYDADKDGQEELYIFSIFSSDGTVDIYRIILP